MYHGYTNQESFELCLYIDNDQSLYRAVQEYMRELLSRDPKMSKLTLGRNVKDRVFAWLFGGGWGFETAAPMFGNVAMYVKRDWYGMVSDLDLAECALDMIGDDK